MAMLLQIWFHLIVHSKGVIQQLRRLNFTQLYSLPSLEWTIVDILHDTYPMNPYVTGPSVHEHSTDPLPPLLVHVVIECP